MSPKEKFAGKKAKAAVLSDRGLQRLENDA
jgi:hypothetical protein